MKAKNEVHITEIELEHKVFIVDLETRAPRMPPIEHEARVAELKGCSVTIDSHLVEAQKLLDKAMHTWTTMEEIDG